MEDVWEVSEDDSEFTQIVDAALAHGAQVVAQGGREVVVVISMEEYRPLKQRQSLSEFFRNSPLVGADLDLERDRSPIEPGPDLE